MEKSIVWALAAGLCMAGGAGLAESASIARIGASGDVLELSHQVEGGTVLDTLPLHRAGTIRYFSAGVGLEERAAEYPPFSLKVVFTAGGRPYLSGVSVAIQSAKEGTVLTVPHEQVDGPWLFLDLPAGDYDVTATYHDHKQGMKGVKVEAGKQKVIHLRWAEDRGIAGSLAGE
ncbi:MAG: hypothetical protein ACT4O4_01070 [Nitrospiraceae bacterium]